MRALFFILILLSSFDSFCQETYSAEDRVAIEKKRLEEEIAIEKTDRVMHYRIGLFFEQMHRKYGDETIYDAIRNYIASASSEGELFDKESYQAAYRLGEIYAKGLGARMNIDKALFFYMLSDSLGKTEFDQLRKENCEAAFIWTRSDDLDTLQLVFSPFCIGKNIEIIKPLLEKLRSHPERKLHVFLHFPKELLGLAYYHYYNTVLTPQAARQVFSDLLSAQGIDPERLVLEEADPSSSTSHWMELVVK